jgi:hypothetical protein
LDFAIGVGTSRPESLAIEMKGHYRPGGEDDPLRGVIDGYVEAGEGSVRYQLIMLPERLTRYVFESVRPMALMDYQVPVVSWQALVLVKLYGGGPQDRLDAEQIFKVQRPTADQLRTLAQKAEELGLAQEWAGLSTRVGIR